jgi:hypothetical protein
VEQAIHRPLECQWGVRQAKVHDIWLVQAIWRLEHYFMTIFGLDLDVVIAPSDVECSEERLALQLFEDVRNLGNRIDVADRPLVNFPVVLDWS